MANLGEIMKDPFFKKEIRKITDAAKKENWEYVDSEIPSIVADSRFIRWACKEGIENRNGNVRDLGVSILEKSKITFNSYPGLKDTLHSLMKTDANPYVRYRSAFTLAGHGAGKYKKEVVEVLNSAVKDKDVSEIAKGYLKKIS